jgi:ssDNA-binding protein
MTAKKVMGNKLKFYRVRLSFPDLFIPTAFEEGQVPKYGCVLLLDPKNPVHARTIKEIAAEEARMIKEAWGTAPKGLVLEYTGPGSDRTNQQTGEIYQGYEGMVYVTCKNTNQPMVMDSEKNELAVGSKLVYGGAYCNASANLFCQENKFGRGIRASIRAVKMLGYGEPFGAGHVTDKEFDDFDTDDEGLAMADALDDDGL